MTRRRRMHGFPVSLAAAVLAAACGGFSPEQTAWPVAEALNVEARMRDGVILRADVYRPDAEGTFPAILRRTPYSKNVEGARRRFRELASLGYVVVVQDTRGRYTSEGVARPHDEAEDGYDTVEWVASLPWVNGRVGMYGGSYLATTQLTAASLAPPHLTALFPSASYASRYDMVFQGGAFYLSDGLGWNLGQAADVRRRLAGVPFEERDGPIGLTDEQRRLLREDWVWRLPLVSMRELDLPELAPGYYAMLAHPSYDEFWETFDISRRHDAFEVPALHITGWYDALLPGTLANFVGLRAAAKTAGARSGQRLIVGPWTHAGPTLESTRIGEVDYGPSAGLDSWSLMRAWFDYWLRDGDPDVVEGAPVRIFVMGANVWRDEAEWPPARARPTALHLRSGGSANTRHGDGRLSFEAPGDDPPDRYAYDPSDPVPTGEAGGYSRAPYDPSAVEEREDVLVYTSEPLDTDLEVTGYVTLVLHVASSALDTDFTGKLVDVFPDGSARTLTDGILRARYRNGKTTPELLVPGEPTRLEIDLLATSNVFRAGHRIRLEVSSSNFPRFDRNPNTGAPFGTDGELRIAEQTVFHDSERPSHLLLPVIPR